MQLDIFRFAEVIFEIEVRLHCEKYLILILRKIKKLNFECTTFIQNGSIDFNYPPEWEKTENHLKKIFKLYI